MTITQPQIRAKITAARRARETSNRKARQDITVIGLKNDRAAMAALRTLLKTDKGTLKAKAERAGVSPATIANVRDNVTKYPRFSTLLGIVNAYGFQVQLSDAEAD